MRLFIQTGITPPRGHSVKASIVKPSRNNQFRNKATPLVFGTPYRRVYRDNSTDPYTLFAIVDGKRAKVFMQEES